MPFVEGGLVEDVVSSPRQSGGFVEGGLSEPLTPDDSYQRVIQYEQGASDETPSKDEYLAYLQAKKTKPLLGERPMATLGEAALETGKMLATLPYRAGEAVGDVIMPQLTQEGLTPMDVAVATGAEVAARSELGARRLSGGLQETLLSEIDNLAQRFGQTLRSDDDKYQAFLGLADVKRKLAKAQSGEQLASQEFLQAYNLPQEAISQAGLEVGGFLAAPENIAFAGGGKLAGQLLGGTARALPAISGAAQRTGARIGTAARVPEVQAGRAVTAITGSEAAGQAVERAIGTGTTGVAAAEALGLPVAGNIPIPGAGMAASAIGTAKAVGAGLETLGEAGAISGGEALSPIQRGLLGFGERIAAQEGASRTARAFGNVLARTGADVIVPKTASILVPALGAGAAGGLLAGMTGEEGDQIAAAIGSGFAFGGIESGIRMAAAKGVFDANRVRSTATEDLNTRPNDVQFTYIEPTTKAEQTVTLKDRDARAQLYEQLDDKQLVKALSEIANAENAGVDVVFHKDGDPVPQDLQQVRYKGVALSTDSVKSGRPTILVNVDKAAPETIPHEILHARITSDMVARIGSQIIEGNIDKAQFKSFANKYAKAMLASGAPAKAKAIFDQVKSAFDPKLQRAQRIDALRYMADEFAAYYTQEFLAGKDPKTVLPGRLPSFFEAAFNSAKEAVSDKFTQKALQSGFDPIAKTFYGPDGKRIKIPWMDDAIKQLIIERKGFEPSEQKLDMRKLTPNQQAALVMSRGFEDLYILNPDGSIGRPKTGQELKLQDIDIAQRSIKLLDSLPAADRGTVTGLDAKGNTIIEGRLSLAEADALARSGIYSASTSRYLGEIARAIVDGSLLNGSYWKVYGRSGRPGVFGESQKLFLPYGIRLNSAGGVIVKVVDFGKVQARMDAALQKQAYKNLFRSYDQAMSTLRDVYLKNLADPNGKPSAEALGGGVEGAKKRNFFNEVMGAVPKKGDVMINEPTAGYTASRKGGSVYEDLRIERVQNVEQTGMKIPWSGDMGEQSSYRRTQLNFQPAETIGDKSVESDANAGFRILSSRGKFRLYSPDGDLLGIYDSAGQAKLKAEKTYATQTRVQSENDQQQRLPGDEGRQTAEAGNRNRALDSTQGREEGGQALGQVRQAGDVGARFMPDVDPDLIALHNTSEEGIRAALRLGGIPVPSIGITKKNTAFTGYGDITLIADRSTIDPQLDPRNKVFSSDVYSPRQPRPHQPVKRGAGDKVYKKMQSLIPEGFTSWSEIATGEKAHELIVDKGPDNVAKTIDKLSRSSDVMAAFLSEQGVAVPRITQEPRLRNRLLSNETIKDPRLNVLRQHKDDLSSFINTPEGIAIGDIVRDIALDPYSSDPNMLERARRNLVSRVGEYGTELPFSEAAYLQSDLETVASAKKEIDRYAIKDWLTEQVANRKPEFDKWITNLVADVFDPQQFIVSGKTKKPYTLENLVGQMTRKVLAQEGGMTYSLGKARASSASTLPTVEAMRSASGSLTDSSKMKEFKDSLSKEFSDIAETMSKYDVFSSVFDRMDRLSEAVGKIVKRPTSASSVLSRADFKDVPVEVVKRVQAFAEKLNKAPTEYFEAKPQRAVGINEFKAAVVPESTSPEVVNALKQSGLTVETYKGSEDRVATVERVSGERNLRFMPSDAEHLSAVEAGDTAKAQELVDQAAKAAGYTVGPVYHGTNAEFTEFKRGDLGIHFGTKEQAAGRGGTREIRAFLKAKPIRIDDDPGFWMGRKIVNLLSDQGVNKTELTKLFNKAASEGGSSGEPNSSADILARGLIELGIDSIQYPNKFEGVGDSVVVLDPSQIKSADPITRDNQGNIIPLSQRFQSSSPDIRYMPAPVPDPSIPGAYSMSGYRILPGKTNGKLRVYSPDGSLAGVVGSVDDAQRMIQKKLQ